MGWFSDFIENPVDRIGKDVSNPGAAAQGFVNGINDFGTQIDQGVRRAVPGGWALPATLAALYYGMPSGESSSWFGAPASTIAEGEAVTAPVTSGAVESSSLGPLSSTPPPPPPLGGENVIQAGTNTAMGAETGDAANGIRATAGPSTVASGTNLATTSSNLGATGYPSYGESLGYGGGSTGVTAAGPGAGYFAGETAAGKAGRHLQKRKIETARLPPFVRTHFRQKAVHQSTLGYCCTKLGFVTGPRTPHCAW